MTPFFLPAIGVLVVIGGVMSALAGAPITLSIILMVSGSGLALGSLLGWLFSKGK